VANLIETTLWIDFTRARSPRALKDFVAGYIVDAAACIAEPIAFEILRYATSEEQQFVEEQLRTMPLLASPATLWTDAAALGRRCREHGLTPGSLDLLIATVAMHHGAHLLTFDSDFEHIARVSNLQVRCLRRPV
jgi:predicted nucleic acid-binding protein